MLIEQTPIAGVPIQFNSEVSVTDETGTIIKPLDVAVSYSITSALDAISFPMLYDTGSGFLSQSPLTIQATRLINGVRPPCRLLVQGTSTIYFSATNQTDLALTIPLIYPNMNSILSVTGGGTPVELFAPGTSGFTVPESHFSRADGLAGVWRFLGVDIPVPSEPSYCTDAAIPSQCQILTSTLIQLPFTHTQSVVQKLVQQSLAAVQKKTWKPANGKFSPPFLKRAASALAGMRPPFDSARNQYLKCESSAASTGCRTITVPKDAYIKLFTRIYTGTWPAGLGHLKLQEQKSVKKFKAELRKVPDTYIVCPK
ncbi:MAG: hypothetical protein P3A33_07240 [Gemmatimonadota bacterium]|nr:hypothetical protein [Gemmatimonadota bacterium]